MAITAWMGRVSPLFDVARQAIVMETDGKAIISRETHDLEPGDASLKAAKLSELGVDVLICGAVSRPLADMIVARGIKLVPFLAGEIEQVAQAYLAGIPVNAAFAMPGCHGGRHGCRGRNGRRGMGARFAGGRGMI